MKVMLFYKNCSKMIFFLLGFFTSMSLMNTNNMKDLAAGWISRKFSFFPILWLWESKWHRLKRGWRMQTVFFSLCSHMIFDYSLLQKLSCIFDHIQMGPQNVFVHFSHRSEFSWSDFNQSSSHISLEVSLFILLSLSFVPLRLNSIIPFAAKGGQFVFWSSKLKPEGGSRAQGWDRINRAGWGGQLLWRQPRHSILSVKIISYSSFPCIHVQLRLQ